LAKPDIALLLIDAGNEYQQLARQEAEAAAKKAEVPLAVRFSGIDLVAQLDDIRKLLGSPARPAAILIMAIRDRGLVRFARDAARTGVHWVFLNRSEDEIGELSREFPAVTLATVCLDEVETGRVQGRIIQALLPGGGNILLVEGTRRSLAARDRTLGLEEATAGTTLTLHQRVEAGWGEKEGYEAVRSWLNIALRANRRIDIVACHNDLLAVGAVAALRETAKTLGRPDLAHVPVVGCDGTPAGGQALVLAGTIAATVVLPRSAGPAVELVAARLAGGPPPPPLTLLHGAPFPPLEKLQPPGR
jgi:ABC-type sugar transport system substrate-binding protein